MPLHFAPRFSRDFFPITFLYRVHALVITSFGIVAKIYNQASSHTQSRPALQEVVATLGIPLQIYTEDLLIVPFQTRFVRQPISSTAPSVRRLIQPLPPLDTS